MNGLDGHPVVEEKMVSGTPEIIWVHAVGADGEREGYDTGG